MLVAPNYRPTRTVYKLMWVVASYEDQAGRLLWVGTNVVIKSVKSLVVRRLEALAAC